MKQKTSLQWPGVSVLIVAVLAVMAFVGGDLQIWLLSGAFAVWGVWAIVYFLVPYLKAQVYRHKVRELRKQSEQQAPKKEMAVPDLSDPIGLVLLRHVNFRISAYLQSAYPDATWQWMEEFPKKIVARGGKGKSSFTACRTSIMPRLALTRRPIFAARC